MDELRGHGILERAPGRLERIAGNQRLAHERKAVVDKTAIQPGHEGTEGQCQDERAAIASRCGRSRRAVPSAGAGRNSVRAIQYMYE